MNMYSVYLNITKTKIIKNVTGGNPYLYPSACTHTYACVYVILYLIFIQNNMLWGEYFYQN